MKIGKAVYAKDLTPEERRRWVEKHDDYVYAGEHEILVSPEAYHLSIGFLSDRSIPKARSCKEGYFGD